MTADVYALTPLLDACGHTSNAARLILGVSGRRWRNVTRNGMDWLTADRWAVAFGFHPYEVWPDMLDHALNAHPVICQMCPREVERKPMGVPGRFCSSACRQRARARRRRVAKVAA